jgi:hypothetical protein
MLILIEMKTVKILSRVDAKLDAIEISRSRTVILIKTNLSRNGARRSAEEGKRKQKKREIRRIFILLRMIRLCKET